MNMEVENVGEVHQVWKKYVDEYLGEFDLRKACTHKLGKAVQDGDVKLFMIVEYMEAALTSKNVDDRCRGTRLLADVLHFLPTDFLTEKELEFLNAFFCDRLKDHHSVVPHVLYGLLALAKAENISGMQVVKFLQALFQDVHTQTHVHTDRRTVFTMFAALLDSKLDYLVDILGVNFVYGYIQAIDGEKDPRNLIQIFNAIPTITKSFPLGEMVEDFFEVISCYFPVDFQPPANDPFDVSRQDLELSLRKCLTSTSKFAEFCIPLIQEKLDSDIADAKLDSLNCLKDGACVFTVEKLEPFLSPLWSALRKELFSARNEEIETAAREALTSLTKCAASRLRQIEDKDETFEIFVSTILKECKHHVVDTDALLRHGGSKILASVAVASVFACSKVLDVIVPVLLQNYGMQANSSKRDTLNLISRLVDIFATYSNSSDLNLDFPKRSEVVHLFMTEIASEWEELRVSSVDGFVSMLKAPEFLDEKLTMNLIAHIIRLCLNEEKLNVRKSVMALLSELGEHEPNQILQTVVPSLTSVINEASCEMSDRRHSVVDRAFESCIALSSCKEVVPSISDALVNRVRRINETCKHHECKELSKCLICLKSFVSRAKSLGADLYQTIVVNFLRLVVADSCNDESDVSPLVKSVESLKLVAANIRVVMQSLEGSPASLIVEDVINLFLYSEMINNTIPLKNSRIVFEPFILSSSIRQKRLIVVFEAVVCCVRLEIFREIFSNVSTAQALIDCLITVCCDSNDKLIYESAARCIGAIVNKLESNERMDSLIKSRYDNLEVWLGNAVDYEKKSNMVILLAWFCRGLVLRAHRHMNLVINKIVSLLNDKNVGVSAAKGFDIIVSDRDDVLNEESHCVVRLMYRQRFFVDTVDKLLDGFNDSDRDLKVNFLMAVSYQLKFLPSQVLLTEAKRDSVFIIVRVLCIDIHIGQLVYCNDVEGLLLTMGLPAYDSGHSVKMKEEYANINIVLERLQYHVHGWLVPVLIQSLSVHYNDQIVISSMETISLFLGKLPQTLTNHLPTLVTELLRLSACQSSMNIRQSSLTCLDYISRQPDHLILPLKNDIIKRLTSCLDDRKRIVRQCAAQARCNWYLVGAPGS